MKYQIVVRKTKDRYIVEWDGVIIYDTHDSWNAHTFVNGLEMGITGSKKMLYANSKIIYRTHSALEGFTDYEDYLG